LFSIATSELLVEEQNIHFHPLIQRKKGFYNTKPFSNIGVNTSKRDLSNARIEFYYVNAVKCNLMELITKSSWISLVVSDVDTYVHVSQFHLIVDCIVVNIHEALFWHFGSVPFPSLFPLSQQCDGCLFLHGGS